MGSGQRRQGSVAGYGQWAGQARGRTGRRQGRQGAGHAVGGRQGRKRAKNTAGGGQGRQWQWAGQEGRKEQGRQWAWHTNLIPAMYAVDS